MVTISVSRDDLRRIKSLSDRGYKHETWIGVFGCNSDGKIWPQNAVGLVPVHRRIPVEGRSSKLDMIVEAFLGERQPRPGKPRGGRIFINNTGAYYTDDRETMTQFAQFKLSRGSSISDLFKKAE